MQERCKIPQPLTAGVGSARAPWWWVERMPGWQPLLGAAYGIVEKGLMLKSFFGPNWPNLVSMHGYGRWLGVN
ncbi:MAG TPA: hypothetical protein VF355_02670 [Anaerolineaceae bacterium]